ncbi:MAG: hypothetical protein J7479_19705, partial [Roseiflexus sp.]|nr:hypothetical protein [Roseiflexus sp.]
MKPRLRGRFAPGDRLCGRRGSVHAGGRPAKSLPEAISIAERFLERSIFCYAPLAVGLKPSAMQGEARLRGTRTPTATLSPLAYRLSAIAYRLSLIGYRLSAIAYRL